MRPALLFLFLMYAANASADAAGAAAAVQLIGSSLEISCRASTASSNSRSATGNGRDCYTSSDCHSEYECSGGQCVSRQTAQPPPQQQPPADCRDTQSCPQLLGAAPRPTMRRQGSELLVRERVTELRQELALGRGPVISGLAGTQGVTAVELGRTLRQHRAELSAIIGDASNPQWPARFLDRVEELRSQS